MATIANITKNTQDFLEIHHFYFWDTQNPEKNKRADRLEKWLLLIKEYGPYGPQGPWAHKTKMFLLSSYYVVIIILIMMIQSQGQGPGAKARTQKRRWAVALDHHDQDDDDYVVTT